jgi:hypothetical protein
MEFNPLKLICGIIKYSAPTPDWKQHFSIIEISELVQFSEIIAFYTENHMKPMNKLWTKCRIIFC